MSSYRLRKQIIQYCQRLDAKSFVANHDGNLSARLPSEGLSGEYKDRFLATPTARGKFDLKETDLIVVDRAGKTKAGTGKIFGEWAFHAEIYKSRPDVNAIVHAHPPHASSFGLGGETLPIDFWPEAVVSLGRHVPCVSPGVPDQKESLVGLAQAARSASACLMAGNGVFAWGSSLEQAYLRLELVEHLSRIFTLARIAGTLQHLPPDTTRLLMEKRKKAGLLSPEELFHA